VVELLISRGASVNAVTVDRYTPLHIAAKEGHDDIASLLLERGVRSSPTTKVSVVSISVMDTVHCTVLLLLCCSTVLLLFHFFPISVFLNRFPLQLF